MAKVKAKKKTNSDSINSTDSYKKAIFDRLDAEDKNLISFVEIYLEKISQRTLFDLSPKEWVKFLNERYDFFKVNAVCEGEYYFKQNKDGNHYVLEWVFEGVTHAMITIEALFLEYKINIHLRFSPVMGVECKNNEIKKISHPDPTNKRIACLYMEFDPVSDEILDQLKERMAKHILAVKTAGLNQPSILQELSKVREIAQNESIKQDEPIEEWIELIDWITNNFYFSGFASYQCQGSNGDLKIQLEEATRKGILDKDYIKVDTQNLKEHIENLLWVHSFDKNHFAFETIKVRSPLHRFEDLMCFTFKTPSKKGGPYKFYVFLGLIKHSSLQTRNLETPLIRLNMQDIFEAEFMAPESFSYNEVIRIFDSIPKFELFRRSSEELLWMIRSLLSINGLHNIRGFSLYRKGKKKQVWLVIAIPTYNFSYENLEKIQSYLLKKVPHSSHDFIKIHGHSTMSRIHAYFDIPGEAEWSPDMDMIEQELMDLTRSWEDKIKEILSRSHSASYSQKLTQYYLPMMPSHYRGRVEPKDAVRDILHLEKLAHSEKIQFDLEDFVSAGSAMHNRVSLIHVYSHSKIDLIKIMPVLKNMGLYVYDQITTRIGKIGTTAGYVQSFRVSKLDHDKIDVHTYKKILGDLLVEIFDERTADDPLNSLVLFAKMNWRMINVLQLYRNLLLQMRTPYSVSKINSCLLKYPRHSCAIYQFFNLKFNPNDSYGDIEYRSSKVLPELSTQFADSLNDVHEVADDTILRRLFNLVEATLRTNFYIPKDNGDTFISVKLESSKIEQIPIPTPYREMFVYDVGVEGTHLRFGAVARGGLRWSDRHDDFRTEVLGLVKTQQTKNVVIVPVGSKGGFIVKTPITSREQGALESNKQYRKFISGLLDITDNMDSTRKASHPSYVLPYDGLDPYLVVAADKGTATFSDTANEISQNYGFWLGDGFASGGSNGYDHKKEGITARGGWECVKLHFNELGKDIQTETTSVVAIGDMSGDVFGNGMLLSKCIQLKAAFNHIHIFLDPNPEPSLSWEERKRLFDLPRSTWKDYNPKLISKGGGVFDRSAKAITLSPEVKDMLGVDKDVLNGEEVIQHVIKMKTELFWFGGIGTYIKSDSQNNVDVGDRANDGVRVNTSDIQALVVGEGANLGLTQLGRIELDKKGMRLNTDAVDNSAGVNMSDYEVNIKILLQLLLDNGKISTTDERNSILEKATDEVSELVLANNRGQHRLLSMDKIRSLRSFKVFKNLIGELEQKGLNTKSENIPVGKELEALEHSGAGMPRPILAVIQAYVKMGFYDYLLSSDVINDRFFDDMFIKYFPLSIREKFGEDLNLHPLKREIITTVLTNKVINQGGSCFLYRTEQQSGKNYQTIVQCYLIVCEIFGGDKLRGQILHAPDVSAESKYEAYLKVEETIQLIVQQMLKISGALSFDMISEYKNLLSDVEAVFEQDGEELALGVSYWKGKGYSMEIAKLIALINMLKSAPDLIYLNQEEKINVSGSMKISMAINDIFHFDWLNKKLNSIDTLTDWELSLQDILLQNLELYKSNLLRFLVDLHGQESLSEINEKEILSSVTKVFEIPLKNFFSTVDALKIDPLINLTTLSVSINRLNFLAGIKFLGGKEK